MVVFDTNILVSASLLKKSRPDLCVREVLRRKVPLVFSNATFAELADVLMRSKFDRYVSRQARVDFLKSWRASAIFVPDVSLAEIVTDCRDSKDNKFLELALAAGVRVIVSGDPDLLSLDPWRGVRVVELSRFEEVVLPIIDQAGA